MTIDEPQKEIVSHSIYFVDQDNYFRKINNFLTLNKNSSNGSINYINNNPYVIDVNDTSVLDIWPIHLRKKSKSKGLIARKDKTPISFSKFTYNEKLLMAVLYSDILDIYEFDVT